MLSRGAVPVLDGLLEALEHLHEALAERRPAAADAALLALARADGVQDGLVDTLEAAGEAARLSPQRRGAQGGLDRYSVAAGQIGRVIEDLRALARGALRAVSAGDAVPPEAVQGIDELAVAVRALQDYLEGGEPAEATRGGDPRRRARELGARGDRQPVGAPHRRPDPDGGRGPAAGHRPAARRGPGGGPRRQV